MEEEKKHVFHLSTNLFCPDLALAQSVLTLSQDYNKTGTTLEPRPLQLKVTSATLWCRVPLASTKRYEIYI